MRLGTELFHVACAEPTLSDSPAWRERQIGTLHQLAEGVGRSTVV